MNVVSYRLIAMCLAVVTLMGCPSPQPTSDGGTGGGGGGGGGGGAADSGPGFTDGGGNLPQAMLCSTYAAAYCDREKTCTFLDQAQYPDCIARATTHCTTALSRVTSGLHTYNPAAAFACVGVVKNDPCTAGNNFFGSGSMFTYSCLAALGPGVATVGSVCVGTSDCAAGFCQSAFPACSTCKAYSATGALCTSLSPCNPVTSGNCPSGFADGGLVDGGSRLCPALAADGTPCVSDQACLAQYCNFNSFLSDAGVDICGFRKLGQACASPDDCNTLNYCKGLVIGATSVTTEGTCTVRIGSGLACVFENVDPTDGCPVNEACLSGVCKKPGMQMANEPCSASAQCIPALYCELSTDGGMGSCLSRAAVGAACSTSSAGPNPVCVTGSSCPFVNDGGTSVCVAAVVPSAAGGSCRNSNADCKELLQCTLGASDAGVCGPYAMAGASCEALTTVCANGNTGLGYCATVDAGQGLPRIRTCANPSGAGTACTSSSQCSSARCVATDGGFASTLNPGTCLVSCLP